MLGIRTLMMTLVIPLSLMTMPAPPSSTSKFPVKKTKKKTINPMSCNNGKSNNNKTPLLFSVFLFLSFRFLFFLIPKSHLTGK